MKNELLLENIGSKNLAAEILTKGKSVVPAYQNFIQSAGSNASLNNSPWTDKSNYLKKYSYREILGDDFENTFTVFASSGSSGAPFYWPQLREGHFDTVPRLAEFLETSFRISKKKTLAIVGLALGSWIGGEHISWMLKNLAISRKFPFSVFSPGNHHDEIIQMIVKANEFVDQFILFLCPSAIAHLKLCAEAKGVNLPMNKLRFVVLGEAFPETVRETIQESAGLHQNDNVMISIYGSADTGTLGVESQPSIALRKLLAANPKIAMELGIMAPTPHFFHCIAHDAYLEIEKNELIITKWQGVPLFRYNLHDSAALISWQKIKSAVLGFSCNLSACTNLVNELSSAPDDLPDLLAITGRADSTLILCGTNFSEAMLDSAVKCRELSSLLTGCYRAKIVYNDSRQRLAFDLEFKKNRDISAVTKAKVYELLIKSLGRAQPEFLNDWRNIYKEWDKNSMHCILELNCVKWPKLSDQTGIKQRGILK